MSQKRFIAILFYFWSMALIAIDIAAAVVAYPSRLWWACLLVVPLLIYYIVKTIRMFGWLPR